MVCLAERCNARKLRLMSGQALSATGARGGIAVAPEHHASQAGISILMDGGTAIEAAVAMAAALGVTYPHMTGMGGDAFWLVQRPGDPPLAIMGCGGAGEAATLELYRGQARIAPRGPLAANTVAGAVSSWQAALALPGASRLGLARVLRDAIDFAADGVPVAPGLARTIAAKREELSGVEGWSDLFGTANGSIRNARLAKTMARVAAYGLQTFYTNGLADDIAADLAEVGAPVTRDDLAMHRASVERPLHVRLKDCVVSSSPPPTQGFASLLIMALIDRVGAAPESLAQVHAIVEATKLAFAIRNRDVHDPAFMTLDCQGMLDDVDLLDMMAARINPAKAARWPPGGCAGDTTWIGAADRDGCVVSMIQSIYFEFGSGVVLPRTGLLWQNRGTSFRLAADGWNALAPGRLPFHTLNPSMALFDDGRVMAFGAMGGEGQPQTQAALFTRYARNGMSLADSVAAPRWLLGRTWGDETTALRVESRLDAKVVDGLRDAGHAVKMVEDYSDLMGHAGAIVRHGDGALDGASDPRADGGVAWT